MGTRSIIAVPYGEDSWRGRYVHWDGYPAHMGKELSAIILRDGYDKAVQVLTEDHKSWSSIHSNRAPDGQGGTFVPGYGVAHNDIPDRDYPWLYPGDEDWTEWVYLLLRGGIVVYERSNSDAGDQFRGMGDDGTDWDRFQENAYSLRQEV